MTRKQTTGTVFHFAILALLGLGALTAYFCWILPLGAVLEMAFWLHFLKWD